MQNGNGFVHGFAPTKDGKEKDGWTTSENHVGNSLEVDYGERDEMNVLKVIFSRISAFLIFLFLEKQFYKLVSCS